MKRLAHGLVLALFLVFGLTTATLAQPPPVTPTPTLTSPEACPAKIRFSWDVTSIAGADRIQWQILRGAPGSDLAGAISVSTNNRLGAIGSLDKDLREFGPVLDGTRYFVRVRAQRAGSGPIAEFSEPVIFQGDELPDGMASAEALPAGGGPGLRIEWNLTGGIGACANRIVYRIDKTDGSASVGGAAAGVSSTTVHDLSPYGPGVYDVIVRAAHNGDTPDDAVGREDFPIRVIVAPPGAEPIALRVDVRGLSIACAKGTPTTLPGVIVRVAGNTPGPGGILFDEARRADATGRATFTVPPGITYTLTTSSPTCEASASASVTPTADTNAPLILEGCHDPQADVRTVLAGPGSATAGVPFSLTVTLTHGGGAGPSRAGTLVVERRNPDASGRVVLDTRDLSGFCPFQERSFTITDPSPPARPVMYGAVATLRDVDETNNVDSRSVVFAAAAPPPVLVIDAFSLQGGASSVLVSTPVTLDATIRGGATPTRYRAAVCGADFLAASFQPWPAAARPTLPGFTTAGSRVVCFQVQNQTPASSATVLDSIQVVTPLAIELAVPGASTAPLFPISIPVISSFQIRDGAPFVTEGRSVSLDVTLTGTATEYRWVSSSSSACEGSISGRPWEPFPASSPPTLAFGRTGRRYLCIQLRGGGGPGSSVAKDYIDVVPESWFSSVLGRSAALTNIASGIPVTLRCEGDRFAVGIVVRSANLVDAIALRCADLGANGEHQNATTTAWVGDTGGTLRDPLSCPSGQVLYGLQGRFGEWIDRVEILCIPWRSDIGSNGVYEAEGAYGGTNGEPFGQVCPGPLAIWAIDAQNRVGIVGSLRIHCQPPPGM